MRFLLTADDIASLARELRAGLSKLSFGDNFECFFWSGDILAGEEFPVPNLLFNLSGKRSIPTNYLITKCEGPPTVSKGSTEWDENYVYLKNRASTSSVYVEAYFFK